MNAQFNLLNKPVKNVEEVGTSLYKRSLGFVMAAQTEKGGLAASPSGTRYAGYIYPRDHAYSNRALLSANEIESGRKALAFMLECPLSEEKIMFQRYSVEGKNESYKAPQIDGNAQTVITLAEYVNLTGDSELLKKFNSKLDLLLTGIKNSTKSFENGDLVFSENGIIEFSPFEEGFEIYTNACCYKSLMDASLLYKKYLNETGFGKQLRDMADRIKKGISYYLYHEKYGGFISCLRVEPNSSIVLSANLKAFLALSDFDVFAYEDEKMTNSLKKQLRETTNNELGGYNRYSEEMDRHNFGNGPWPMVMLRLANLYYKTKNRTGFRKCLDWVLNVALNNDDVELGLPEHVSTKEELTKAYETFLKIDETAPRQAKRLQYETIMRSKTLMNKGLSYAVNPLVWSHAQFVMTWNKVKDSL